MNTGLLVTKEIRHAHALHEDYPLLEDDLLQLASDGSYTKVCPGLAIAGFKFTDEQISSALKVVEFQTNGLDYLVKESS